MKNFKNALTTGDRKVVRILVGIIAVSAILATLTACTKDDAPDGGARVSIYVNGDSLKDHRVITFACHDISIVAMGADNATRATMSEVNMTDLWLFDYVGDELKQTIHQTASDADFGNPTINAAYGDHTIYFVASRGDSPVIDGTTIFWAKPSDTFWASRSITIAPATATNQSVSLQRVATRLRLTVTDEIPATLAQICITPSHWYYGIDYLTGEATDDRQTERTINVPASYIGTTGQLYANFYSMSPSSAWQTDITMKAKDGDGGVISQIGIADVPLERNRVTNYSGTLFNANRTVTISVDSDWGEDISGTW
jgi:hypothetical protein